MTAPLILDKIVKGYQDGKEYQEILSKVSLSVEKGQTTAVIGPSGSGKSTFLSVAGALLSPDSGAVIINGQSIAGFSAKQLANIRLNQIGYIFQAANLVPYLTVKEQLKLVIEMNRNWSKDAQLRVKEALGDVGLGERLNAYPHQLSGGEKQRVAIARAFMNDPDIILADEPTANLDQARSHEIVRLIAKEAKEKNKAAILVTHDEKLLEYCSVVYTIEAGELVKRT
ncbi:putative ABC transport system ATP-binding protein [Amphibacillus marinus]|uniref:Putative hemin import ATP-binding protein HrtA n=1 Tax=Amphibacillus marinus TaxID=872970 RepID=A0A1H8QDV3_9BACI|nr:ABC transporter ATP-binding protein [Amphibacillus marinus]SEO52188.1 putative ABC transport system ATP-binding protein [Amphibacillus marinus]